jgi:hypothetical protein
MPKIIAVIAHTSVMEWNRRQTEDMVSISATTIGEAVTVAEKLFRARIVPNDPPKWWRFYPEGEHGYLPICIHVQRGDEVICPKQDAEFHLLPEDEVWFSSPAC